MTDLTQLEALRQKNERLLSELQDWRDAHGVMHKAHREAVAEIERLRAALEAAPEPTPPGPYHMETVIMSRILGLGIIWRMHRRIAGTWVAEGKWVNPPFDHQVTSDNLADAVRDCAALALRERA